MGLDTTHNCWHGPYTHFSTWRNAVAKAAGYQVDGLWDESATDPLVVLLAHSDCDGSIPSALCQPLALRLVDLLPKMPQERYGDEAWLWPATAKFIAGLLLAGRLGEDVLFQ